MNEKKKVGIVGFGKMGMLYGGLLSARNDVDVVAITDTSKNITKIVKKFLPDIHYFTDHKKMIGEIFLDAIIITTPSLYHTKVASDALLKNIHIFIEKPLSNSLFNAKMLLDKMKNRNIESMVGFCMRHIPTIIEGKKIIERNELGRIQYVESYMYSGDVLSPQTGWRYNPKISGGGVVIDFAIHLVDLLYWYFGKPNKISAKIEKIYSKEVEDKVIGNFFYPNNFRIKIESSWSNGRYRKPYVCMKIFGSSGLLEITDQTVMLNNNTHRKKNIYYPELYLGYYLDIGGPNYSIQINNFIESIKTRNRKYGPTIKEAFEVQEIIEGIYESVEKKSPIFLNNFIDKSNLLWK